MLLIRLSPISPSHSTSSGEEVAGPGSAAPNLLIRITDLADTAQLTQLITPHATALGFDLVRVRLFGAGDERTLQVMAERPDTRQLTIDDCAALSRRLSDMLDEMEVAGTDPIDSEYRLEVSSPGIDRPLTRLADFDDWRGHEARVTLAAKLDGRKQFKGDLIGTRDSDIVLALDSGEIAIPFAAIADAKLALTDRLIAATQPLDADGADEQELDMSADADGTDPADNAAEEELN